MEEKLKQLMEIVSRQTAKILQLKEEIQTAQNLQDSDELYYSKYNKAKADNLELQNTIANLEMKLSQANFELERRNKALLKAGIRI